MWSCLRTRVPNSPFLNTGNVYSCLVPQSTSPQPTEESSHMATVELSSLTIMAIELLSNLPLEILLVWKSRWNVLKVLYLLSRYIPFVYLTILLYHQFGSQGLEPHTCRALFKSFAGIFLFSAGVAELMLTIRTWVVWQHNKIMAYSLAVTFSAMWTAILMLTALGLETETIYGSSPPNSWGMGCYVDSNTSEAFIAASYILLAVFDLWNLIAMVSQGFSIYQNLQDYNYTRWSLRAVVPLTEADRTDILAGVHFTVAKPGRGNTLHFSLSRHAGDTRAHQAGPFTRSLGSRNPIIKRNELPIFSHSPSVSGTGSQHHEAAGYKESSIV
ncbi:hypothetical protein NP233_g7663 [Leucocoprinus birnbaumii]|uniref:DUF6533 domain-containing protein n=1 Tax=Leucocoprinus birnbaumii TaxID=56174 RepID=A0AAD5VUA5_9AGAR|nr:hypothetical protein NP233_g7663 [Leucocoprinus birnbaumii]